MNVHMSIENGLDYSLASASVEAAVRRKHIDIIQGDEQATTRAAIYSGLPSNGDRVGCRKDNGCGAKLHSKDIYIRQRKSQKQKRLNPGVEGIDCCLCRQVLTGFGNGLDVPSLAACHTCHWQSDGLAVFSFAKLANLGKACTCMCLSNSS